MTTISAKIILDSISEQGKRLTTVHMRYPRFIHSELMTHRVFSRNARSSRAVPVKTMLEEIRTDPVIPLFWGKNQKGMQASEELNAPVGTWDAEDDTDIVSREEAWLEACRVARLAAGNFDRAGYHKQVVNRLLEPFMHIDVLVSSTEWANFFHLRDHKDAEPHIDLLAKATKVAMDESEPTLLLPGEWHLPYITIDDWNAVNDMLRGDGHPVVPNEQILPVLRNISAARCARISYAPFDGNPSIEREIQRYDDLITNQPVHASPVEHQATPDTMSHYDHLNVVNDKETLVDSGLMWDQPELHGNFIGWCQHRKMIPGEAVW